MTYDLNGDGKSVFQASYSIYYGQLAPGQFTRNLTTTGAVNLDYPWVDRNTDSSCRPTNRTTAVAVPHVDLRPGEPNECPLGGVGGSEHRGRSHA